MQEIIKCLFLQKVGFPRNFVGNQNVSQYCPSCKEIDIEDDRAFANILQMIIKSVSVIRNLQLFSVSHTCQ